MSSREYFLLEKIFSDVEKGGTRRRRGSEPVARSTTSLPRGVKSVRLDVRAFLAPDASVRSTRTARSSKEGEDATNRKGPLLDD